MIQEWSSKEKVLSNEEIEIGANNFIDDRGIISNYYFEDNLNMIGYSIQKISTSII